MRKLLIGVAAAATLVTTAVTSAPADAQVRFHSPGVNVRIGPGHPGYRAYGWDRGHHYGWRHRGGCRTTVRHRLPNGDVVVRRGRC